MNLVNRFQTDYGWTPNFRQVYKRSPPENLSNLFRVPQTIGVPGWIAFTYDENAVPVCMWITSHECFPLRCIVDERVCGDTLLRVERLSPKVFAVSDVYIYNSNCIFKGSSFEQRYNWIRDLLKIAHSPSEDTITLLHKSALPEGTLFRGEELYTSAPATNGFFVEQEKSCILTACRTEIPDVYTLVDKEGYIRVPDLKTSVFLRKKGVQFSIKCTPHDAQSWSVLENIPEVEVNAAF